MIFPKTTYSLFYKVKSKYYFSWIIFEGDYSWRFITAWVFLLLACLKKTTKEVVQWNKKLSCSSWSIFLYLWGGTTLNEENSNFQFFIQV